MKECTPYSLPGQSFTADSFSTCEFMEIGTEKMKNLVQCFVLAVAVFRTSRAQAGKTK